MALPPRGLQAPERYCLIPVALYPEVVRAGALVGATQEQNPLRSVELRRRRLSEYEPSDTVPRAPSVMFSSVPASKARTVTAGWTSSVQAPGSVPQDVSMRATAAAAEKKRRMGCRSMCGRLPPNGPGASPVAASQPAHVGTIGTQVAYASRVGAASSSWTATEGSQLKSMPGGWRSELRRAMAPGISLPSRCIIYRDTVMGPVSERSPSSPLPRHTQRELDGGPRRMSAAAGTNMRTAF